VLRHAARLRALTRGAVTALADASGGGSSVLDALLRALADVRAAAALDPSLGAAAGTLEAVCGEVSLVARELDRHAEAIEEDPSLLDEIEHRLFRLSKLLAKHGPTTAELLAHRARVAADLAAIERAPAVIAGLDHELDLARAEATEAALALSASRRRAARRLGDAVAAELSRLGMPGARVVVEITALPPREGGLQVAIPPGAGDHGAAHLSPDGIDRVEVLLSANRGEPPRPLRRIASGGELSRVLLALKRVFADDGGATLVLDEVDAGVGGAVASAIGEAMRDIARHRQVICVTHLPQIAALADAHFVIEKASRADRTVSRVRRLAEDAREVEIAGMMGGANAGPAARGAARDLLGKPPRVAGARLASGVRLRAV
jgi:DNA repair protein RecN (Recombination protein N)